jgi:hypothetical protein
MKLDGLVVYADGFDVLEVAGNRAPPASIASGFICEHHITSGDLYAVLEASVLSKRDFERFAVRAPVIALDEVWHGFEGFVDAE